ncbi:hypothetical protein ENUP19_0051G0042 [Entamoeba nuttalli]|uniref:Uncharacterized protein n=2 Tax=Entamoeba nuttalli TaxID=412467 RepID=K2H3K0_ENTNP|nr:hypothetical protein ENU1_034440 [Entamoeba nuttalli P19]EKE42053.1 hypothetical protein ENU1_034440 [Entamoeba nuttalli P19]|eukprot:XP_008855610.1 hypothetical protein ENU1_034440 [Entamoeba nuttalli P19]
MSHPSTPSKFSQSPGPNRRGQIGSRYNLSPLEQIERNCRTEMEQVNRFQLDILDKVVKGKQFIKELHQKCDEDAIIMKRDYIPHTDQIQLTTYTDIDSKVFIQKYQNDIEHSQIEMDKIQNIVNEMQKIDSARILTKIQTTEQLLPSINQIILEKQKMLNELKQNQMNLNSFIEQLNTQNSSIQIKDSKHRSIALDIEEILLINNHALLLSYLQSIPVDIFCQTTFKTEVLLSLLTFLVSNLSTELIEIKLSFILLTLKNLNIKKVPKPYLSLFKDIQQTFLSFKEMLYYENYYKAIMWILYLCEDMIEALQN